MTAADLDAITNNQLIASIGEELAVLCRAYYLRGWLPNNTPSMALWDRMEELIDEIIDREMAVDPIEHAITELSDNGHTGGLEALAFALLRRRDDYGNWSAR